MADTSRIPAVRAFASVGATPLVSNLLQMLLNGVSPSVARTYPNDNTNAYGSIPVYLVDSQSFNSDPPNAQNVVGAAIPINLTTLDAFPNAIPIRFVSGTGAGPTWGSDQGLDTNSIPVFYSGLPNAQPVWDAGIIGVGGAPATISTILASYAPLNLAMVPATASTTFGLNTPTISFGTNRVPTVKTSSFAMQTPTRTP